MGKCDAVVFNANNLEQIQGIIAIKRGMCEFNVATAINMAFTQGMITALKAKPDMAVPRKILGVSRYEVKKVVKQKINLFESDGKA